QEFDDWHALVSFAPYLSWTKTLSLQFGELLLQAPGRHRHAGAQRLCEQRYPQFLHHPAEFYPRGRVGTGRLSHFFDEGLQSGEVRQVIQVARHLMRQLVKTLSYSLEISRIFQQPLWRCRRQITRVDKPVELFFDVLPDRGQIPALQT